MRRKTPSGGAANFWPGYVDAMVNVVLNLLFLVAMFAISAAVLGSNKGKAPLVYSPLGDALPGPEGGWPANGTQLVNQDAAREKAGNDLGVDTQSQLEDRASYEDKEKGSLADISSTLQPTRPGNRDSSQTQKMQTLPALSPDKATALLNLPSTQPKRSDGREWTQNREVPQAPELAASPQAIDQQARATSGAPSGTFQMPPAQTSPVPTASLQVNDANKALGASRARITRSQLPGGELLVIAFPAGADPFEEMSRPQIGVTLRSVVSASKTHNLELWAYSPDHDAQSQRLAYVAIASLRNVLVGQGWSPSQIDTRMELGALPQNRELRIYLRVRNAQTFDSAVTSRIS